RESDEGMPAVVPDSLGKDVSWFQELRESFDVWFRESSKALTDFIGLSFDGPQMSGMSVVIACGVITMICGLVGAFTIYMVQTVSRFFAYRVVADLRCELARHFLNL